jgi:hypothetical protein
MIFKECDKEENREPAEAVATPHFKRLKGKDKNLPRTGHEGT